MKCTRVESDIGLETLRPLRSWCTCLTDSQSWGSRSPFPPQTGLHFTPWKRLASRPHGIKLSIFQLRLQVQVQFIMAKKKCWLCEDSISEPFDPETSALPIRHEQGDGISGVFTYSPIVHNQWTQLGTGRTPVGASHLRAILIQLFS